MLRSGFLPHFGLLKGLSGSTWATNVSGRAYNTPTLGSELLSDGGFENWNSATDLVSWIETIGGTSTINRESSIIHGGTYAARIDIDGSNTYSDIAQSSVVQVGGWYLVTVYAKTSTGTASVRVGIGGSLTSYTPTTDYTQLLLTARSVGTSIQFNRNSATGASLYFDTASTKQLTLATLLATTQGTGTQTPLAKVYAIAANTQAGVIGWLDNPASPQNFVIALRNGSGNVNLTKCVAGTYTNLISISSTFVQDAAIEIRRPSGNTFQLWYNGSQVGTNQTINDTAIADNTTPHYGIFSTYSGNTFSEFSLGGNIIPFGF